MKIRTELQKLARPSKARGSERFFKTGRGEYGEGDVFIGVTVPELRILADKYQDASAPILKTLLKSKIHEERLLAVIILVMQYRKADDPRKDEIFHFYIRYRKHINNWDLIDASAHHIVGAHLKHKDKSLLIRFARSKDLWERRISVVATFHYISQGRSEHTFRIARLLLKDEEDLIHKAVGWMLREVGKRCSEAELHSFLGKHAPHMPRTALRYAIERFPEAARRKYLNQKV